MWNDPNKIKFYCYRFYGIEKPIVVEARNKWQARDHMRRIFRSLPKPYRHTIIIGEFVRVPLFGVSEKVINGVKHLWAGDDGWQPEKYFKK